MLRVTIYALDALPQSVREGIADGLDLIVGHMGESYTARDTRAKLPLTQEGLVDQRRVGYGQLDKMVELHLFAVPFARANFSGLAGYGRGWLYVDPRVRSDLIRGVTAHEAAHSLSFVIPSSAQARPEDPHHCCNAHCLMFPRVKAVRDETFRDGAPVADFCTACRRDITTYGPTHLGDLRVARLRRKRV